MLIKSTYHTLPILPFVTGVQTTFSHLCTPPSRLWGDLRPPPHQAQLVAMGQTFRFLCMFSVSSENAAIPEVRAILQQVKLRHLTVSNGPLLTLGLTIFLLLCCWAVGAFPPLTTSLHGNTDLTCS